MGCGAESDTLRALPRPLLPRDRPGNRGGLVTAYSPPAVHQQTHPGDPAPNWADTSAATVANAPGGDGVQRTERGRGDKTALSGDDDPAAGFPAYLDSQTQNEVTEQASTFRSLIPSAGSPFHLFLGAVNGSELWKTGFLFR